MASTTDALAKLADPHSKAASRSAAVKAPELIVEAIEAVRLEYTVAASWPVDKLTLTSNTAEAASLVTANCLKPAVLLTVVPLPLPLPVPEFGSEYMVDDGATIKSLKLTASSGIPMDVAVAFLSEFRSDRLRSGLLLANPVTVTVDENVIIFTEAEGAAIYVSVSGDAVGKNREAGDIEGR